MSSKNYSEAVVIGGSMAGLLAARVLADDFNQVTVVERDWFPKEPGPRKGVPQARHIHGLLIRGLRILEELFPGIRVDLEAAGAPVIDYTGDLAWFIQGRWLARFPSNLVGVACSRDLLEHHVRAHLRQNPRVRFLEGFEADGLLADEQNRRVVGVKIHRRDPAMRLDRDLSLPAQLVVDTSGRASQAPKWLERLGYQPPEESVVNAHLGYASRWYQASSLPLDWKVLAVFGRAPDNPRSGVIFPIEGGRWIITLGGTNGDYPPLHEAGFSEFARSLASPALYEASLAAKPVSSIYGYQTTENRMRHYERLPSLPEGFILLGDAVCAFNPVYGQGMSVAAMGAKALQECLSEDNSLASLPLRFQKRLSKINALPWAMATGEDFRWPSTEGGRPGRSSRLLNAYMDRILALAATQADIKRAFIEVSQLISPVGILFRPGIIWRVLTMKASEEGVMFPSPRRPVLTPSRD